MILREIASHRYLVLALAQPVGTTPVLSLLEDAQEFHPDLYNQMLAMLTQRAPTFDPPLGAATRGIAGEKELQDGLFEFVVIGGARQRRRRAKQEKEERDLGMRIFFFRYGQLIVCTNGCYKKTTTPDGAVATALENKAVCLSALRGGNYQIIREG